MRVEVLFESPEVRLGHAGPLVISYYRGPTTVASLEELDRQQVKLLERYPKLSSMTLVGAGASLIRVSEPVRDKSVELGLKYEKHVLGSAIIVLTKGLGAVMVRSFLSGYFLLSKSEMEMKAFSSITEGLSFIQRLPAQDLSVKTELQAGDLERFMES